MPFTAAAPWVWPAPVAATVSWNALIQFAGGVGLFLLGMRLVSDGLKIAAGDALRDLLLAATGSRWRALGSGVLVTALVQSSSAVIFATIGFVNAGLLSLGQAVGLIFGANLGTTFTSWIVASVGFKLDLQAFALPTVAIGMALWVASRGRRSALGQALTGFGVFFLGLATLNAAFAGIDQGLDLQAWAVPGWRGLLLFTALGISLTVLMQSSSAALAVTLTAASQHVVPLEAAAGMVIGANIGTTSTALFATLGATAAARRSAAAHVLFNLVAGGLALLTLPWLLDSARWLLAVLGVVDAPATALALLHTQLNLLGILALWPLLPALLAWLEAHFGAREREDAGQPRHLDQTVLATPRFAVDAAQLELARLADLAHRMARVVLSWERGDAELDAEQQQVERLVTAIIDFVARINSGGDARIEEALPNLIRAAQYYRAIAERAVEMARAPLSDELDPAALRIVVELRGDADRLLSRAEVAPSGEVDATELDQAAEAFATDYQTAKGELLRLGSRGGLRPSSLVRVLDRLSGLRRIVDQAHKAARIRQRLHAQPDSPRGIVDG